MNSRSHFGLGRRGVHQRDFHFIDSGGEGYQSGNDLMKELGKDKSKVISTVMISVSRTTVCFVLTSCCDDLGNFDSHSNRL
jgi:hypothetical protein